VRLDLDKHADLDSPLHRWDARMKIVGLFVLAFSFAFVTDLRLVPAMLAVSLGICILSRLPARFLWRRLRYPGIFVLFLAVVLPLFSGGTEIFGLGPVSIKEEGTLAFLLILSRFASIVLIGLVVFGTAEIRTNIEALRAVGLPSILSDMMLFSYRYLDELGETLSKMRRATTLRGFTGDRLRNNLSTFASLLGSLLVRSHERSERVYNAMVLRGYGVERKHSHDFSATRADVAALVFVLVLAAVFVVAEISLG
jgi:cobalt/nickel transport system permease protein